MTISTTSNTVVVHGNGLTTSFDFTFPVPLASELFVYYTDATGAVTTLNPSQYSVTGIGTANGGAVTYPLSGSPIASGTSLTIQRIVSYQQLTDLVNQSGYYPNVVENALDYLTMQTQQLAQEQALAITVPLSALPSNLVLPSAAGRATTLVGFDSSGNVIAYPITASVGAGNLTSEGPFVAGVDFTAGVSTTLTLSKAYGAPANVQVHFDGIYQGTDQYTLTGTQITFTSPIPVGVSKVYIVGGTTLSTNVPADGSVTTPKIQDGAVTSSKIAAGAVGATQIANGSVGAAQLAWAGLLSKVVTSISALRALSKTTYTNAFVTGYYATNDGGGGAYYLDAADTTSADNGGTIIVATDGGRWKLIHHGEVYVEQFGAKGDGATDDSTAINNALTYSPFKVVISNKNYRVSSTISVPANKCLWGIGARSFFVSGNGFPAIVGDLAVTPIVSATAGSYSSGVALKNFAVTRASGTIPSGSVGVAYHDSNDSSAIEDLISTRSAIGYDVGNGVTTGLCQYLVRCHTGAVTDSHIRVSNTVETYLINCRLGRNGGSDVSCNYYINVNGGNVDTLRAMCCQFNQSAVNSVGAVLGFTGFTASDPNGIFSFEQCHAEQFGNAVQWDAGSSGIQRVKISNCTFDSGLAGTLFFGASNKLTDCTATGNTFNNMGLTLDQQVNTILTGNKFGLAATINAGSQVVTGNIFAGNVLLEGVSTKTIFVGNAINGSFTNSMSGTTVIANNG